MTESAPPQQEPLQGVAGDAFLVESQAEGRHDFSPARGRHELKVVETAHRQRVEQQRTEHELNEATKDNDARRRREQAGFFVVVSLAVVGLMAGFVVGVTSDDEVTQRWAQGLVTLLFGAIAGGLVGYFTGRVGK